MRFFNTTGPVETDDHYVLDPLQRIAYEEVSSFIDQKRYFILHAPRQTGKTSSLLSLMKKINEEGKYRCLYVNVESAQAATYDVTAGIKTILSKIVEFSRYYLNETSMEEEWLDILNKHGAYDALDVFLTRWCEKSAIPSILFLDEIDALIGDTLISVLRQLRSGYTKRPINFPQSVVLCGVRDVRDYRIRTSKDEIITGGSAFNIKAKSLRLGNFTKEDIYTLYDQHTEETSQKFTGDALDHIWHLTRGQPWLVNALGYQLCFESKKNRDRSILITKDLVDKAKEELILRRDTHLDQLTDKLREDRVHRIIAPIISCEDETSHLSPDDIGYVYDLGLVDYNEEGDIDIANPIYREVIPRSLNAVMSDGMSVKRSMYIDQEFKVDMMLLMSKFQNFFRMHSGHWVESFKYKEAGPQLLLQAFLQRIVNGGGRIEREYALGRRRTDLLVIYPYGDNKVQRIVIELKILYQSLEKTIDVGLKQTADYMDISNANEGHLIIFDRSDISWDEKIFDKTFRQGNKEMKVWGM